MNNEICRYIYNANGDIIREIAQTQTSVTKNSTIVADIPPELREKLANAKTEEPSTSLISPFSDSTITEKTTLDVYNKEYTFSINELDTLIDKQIEGKLKNFLDKSEVFKEQTKAELNHFDKLLGTLLGYKHNNKSNSIAIGAIVAAIIIGFTAPIFINFFTGVNQITIEKELMKKEIQDSQSKIVDINNELKRIEQNVLRQDKIDQDVQALKNRIEELKNEMQQMEQKLR